MACNKREAIGMAKNFLLTQDNIEILNIPLIRFYSYTLQKFPV